jgi:hypothetical protein
MKTTLILALSALCLVSCSEKKQAEPAKAPSTNQNLSITDRTINDKGTNYKISATYPATGNQRLDSIVAAFVTTTVGDFKQGIGPDTVSRWTNELNFTYSSSITRYKYVSFEFDTYTFTGGAHGMTFIHTLNYDLSKDSVVSLAELFTAPTYLDTLSLYCYVLLKDSLGHEAVEDMLRAGTVAKPESFEKFQITPRGLQFHFEPYAVAPYAWGSQQATIPYASLKGILKEEVLQMPGKE